jgi:hypothetical protein
MKSLKDITQEFVFRLLNGYKIPLSSSINRCKTFILNHELPFDIIDDELKNNLIPHVLIESCCNNDGIQSLFLEQMTDLQLYYKDEILNESIDLLLKNNLVLRNHLFNFLQKYEKDDLIFYLLTRCDIPIYNDIHSYLTCKIFHKQIDMSNLYLELFDCNNSIQELFIQNKHNIFENNIMLDLFFRSVISMIRAKGNFSNKLRLLIPNYIDLSKNLGIWIYQKEYNTLFNDYKISSMQFYMEPISKNSIVFLYQFKGSYLAIQCLYDFNPEKLNN